MKLVYLRILCDLRLDRYKINILGNYFWVTPSNGQQCNEIERSHIINQR
jgi:hypothetical protein